MGDRLAQSQQAWVSAAIQGVGKAGLIKIYPSPEQETVEEANDLCAGLHAEHQGLSERLPDHRFVKFGKLRGMESSGLAAASPPGLM
jgi:hypothetical protein